MPLTNNIKILIPFGGAIIFTGAVGYIFYRLLQKNECELKESKPDCDNNIVSLSKEEVKIPRSAIGIIIGRQGHNIKLIQEATYTTINISDIEDKNGDITCTIRGKIEKVEEAKQWILRTVKEIPLLESEQIFVPRNCIGRIIGRKGESIERISRVSGARIKIPDENNVGFNNSENGRLILIKGSKQAIQSAISLIQKQVQTYEETQHQIQESAVIISKRNNPMDESCPKELNINTHDELDKLSPQPQECSENTPLTAYVTAVATAVHFWVQISDSNTIVLAELLKEMTDFYRNEHNKELHEKSEILPDDIVAALFPHDNRWYRGRVCKHTRHDSNDLFPIFFVDFGDTEQVSRQNIYELRTDFLKLKFQAVECILADVDERSLSEKSFSEFLSLTSLGQGRTVALKIVSYNEGEIPIVRIAITNEGAQNCDVAEILVKMGFASWNKDFCCDDIDKYKTPPLVEEDSRAKD